MISLFSPYQVEPALPRKRALRQAEAPPPAQSWALNTLSPKPLLQNHQGLEARLNFPKL